MTRTQVMLMTRELLALVIIVTGCSHSNYVSSWIADKKDDQQGSVDLAEKVLPYCQIASYVLTAAKVILFAVSIKRPRVTKAVLYLETLQLVAEAMMPTEIDLASDLKLSLGTIGLNFWCYAFGWKTGLVCSVTAFAAFAAKRIIFYTEIKLIVVLVMALNWILLQLFVLHLMMRKVGITQVDAIVLRVGNEQTLAKLSEGLVVLDDEDYELLYHNKAAVRDELN